jgi:hypothetical protein
MPPSDVKEKLLADLDAFTTQASNDACTEYLTTKAAAIRLGTTTRALLRHVQRGSLKPDIWGGRGAFREHRFTRETLLAFCNRRKSA